MKSFVPILCYLFVMDHEHQHHNNNRVPNSKEILQLDGRSLAQEIANGRILAEEVMIATLDRIENLNPIYKAIVNIRNREELIQEARECDRQISRGGGGDQEPRGELFGIPFAIKDLSDAAGIPTSMGGSPLYRYYIPSVSDPFVRRIVDEGAIIIGKTNTPEMGCGSHTFNKRWGTTLNPYDPSKSAGGSSGGAAVALTTRMICLADGSDMMGSLRNPAGWNNLYSHRPTAGIMEDNHLPDETNPLPFPITTPGPMARNPLDLALLLQVMAGKDVFDRSQVDDNPQVEGMKIAWVGNWNDKIPVEDGILHLCRGALAKLSDKGVKIDDQVEDLFDIEELWESWTTIRSKIIATNFPLPKVLKRALIGLLPIREELKWEIRRGLDFSEQECVEAGKVAKQWSKRLEGIFCKYDAVALPTAQTWAFPAVWRWPQEIQGTSMTTYHRWMQIVMPGSLGGLPCTTIPAGFGENGLCMGIQLMGKRGEDAKLIKIAQAYHLSVDWPHDKQPTCCTILNSSGTALNE